MIVSKAKGKQMDKHAVIVVDADKASLTMPGMTATDPYVVHDGSREATILYLFKLATMNGATSVEKVEA